MAASLEETLVSVWRQAMAEEAKSVIVGDQKFPVRRTNRSKIVRSGLSFRGAVLRGLEQNPETGSRWAQLTRQGKKVMQFLQQRRYIALVVEGKVQFYGKPTLSEEQQR